MVCLKARNEDSRKINDKRNLIDRSGKVLYYQRAWRALKGFRASPVLIIPAADLRRLSRVAEGTGPMKPQQPGSNAPVLLPAQ